VPLVAVGENALPRRHCSLRASEGGMRERERWNGRRRDIVFVVLRRLVIILHHQHLPLFLLSEELRPEEVPRRFANPRSSFASEPCRSR
jgi:hypothetical protein